MPLYEYKCEKGHVTEKVISLREKQEEQIVCPACVTDGKPADAFLIFSMPSKPVLVAGIGGFHSPTRR